MINDADLDTWRAQIHQMTATLRDRHPQHSLTLDDIDQAADSIAHHRPLAARYNDPGDGLRSPSLEGGSRSGGPHADPTLAAVIAASLTFDPDSSRPADVLRRVDAQRGNATLWLRRAIRTADDAENLRRRRIREARAQLDGARSALHQLLPPPSPPGAKPSRNGDPGCASCRRARNVTDTGAYYVPTRVGEWGRTNLCHWCEKRMGAARTEWVAAHPGQEVPGDRRFWPPLKAIEWRRDNGQRRIPADDWAAWEAEEKKARKAKTKKHKKAG